MFKRPANILPSLSTLLALSLLQLFVLPRSCGGQELRSADFNNDGAIEFIDFYIYTVNADIAINKGGVFEEGDLNGDGQFNLFDGFAFNAQWREANGKIEPIETPFDNELSLIVDDFGNMWAWGLLKPHPGDRKLLMGYSIRSRAGSLVVDKGLPNVFRSFHRRTEFEVIAADGLRFRVDGPRALKTKVNPVDLADLTFRYASVDGVFTSAVYPSIPGDADLDGAVEFSDFLALSTFFGQTGQWAEGDFNEDGNVGFDDFIVLTRNFGQSLQGFGSKSTVAPVPEPRNEFVWVVACWVFLHRRSRRA